MSLLLRTILFLALGGVTSQATVSMDSLLREMVDFEAPARWPQPEYTCKQASSYDRASLTPDEPGWFANSDQNQYIRDEEVSGRKERVMMDAEGPGCIVRFWLTTDRNKQGVLRVYLDGAQEPALVFPAFDLLAGGHNIGVPLAAPHPGYREDSNGGNNLYLPIPYAKHCKVTWEEASQGARYYQINYRTYAPGTEVRSFSRAQLEEVRPLIQSVNKLLLDPPDAVTGLQSSRQTTIAGRKSMSVQLPKGSQAVRLLRIGVSPQIGERQLRSLVLQMVCDGRTNVWCPASDFFGSGVGLSTVSAWYRTVGTNGIMEARWVMPYQESASLSLVNLGERPVDVSMEVITSYWDWDERSMHFNAAWHYENGLEAPPARDWNMITISGRGVYIADTLALFNPVPAWYGEGDEKIWVDAERFPSHFGTGTEDYYGYSYAPKPVHLGPFCGEPRIDQPQTQGHNTSIRSRNLDGIPFRKSLKFDFEILPWKRSKLTYAGTACWYAVPGSQSNCAPDPEAAVLPVPTLAQAIAEAAPKHFPGAIECEKLKVTAKSAGVSSREQDMEPFDASRWSGGAQLLVVPKSVGDYLEIEVPAPDTRPCQLILHATRAVDYAQLGFRVNGEVAKVSFDGFATSVQPAEPLVLGTYEPQGGKYTLRVEVAGANPGATGERYLIGLDYIELNEPKTTP